MVQNAKLLNGIKLEFKNGSQKPKRQTSVLTSAHITDIEFDFILKR